MPINHLAIILDGNRRWAKENGLPSLEGHRRGYDNVKAIGLAALDRGIAHFTEHMVFKGTKTRRAGAIEREIKSYGGYINASTSHDTTDVHLLVKREYLKEVLELLSDLVFNPTFDKAEFEKEREVILSEIRMNRDEPSRRASVLLWSSAYLVHPYRYPVIGYEDLFKKITNKDLKKKISALKKAEIKAKFKSKLQ